MVSRQSFIIILMLSSFIISCNDQPSSRFGFEEATSDISILEKGIISTALYERDLAISPDNKEIIFTRGDYKQHRRCLVQLINKDGEWTKPQVLSISGMYQDIEPFFTPDGQRLFFASDRPLPGETEAGDYNIWYSERLNHSWATPKSLGANINTDADEFFPSLGNSGNLYFTSVREDGIGREDLFMSKIDKGQYEAPTLLDTTINTSFYEFNAFVSPDEDLLIFSSFGRPDGFGGGDLYYSIRKSDGNWAKAINMGPNINSTNLDYCPFYDYSNSTLYFTSERSRDFTQSISELEELEEYANDVQNGMGDIYHVKWSK